MNSILFFEPMMDKAIFRDPVHDSPLLVLADALVF